MLSKVLFMAWSKVDNLSRGWPEGSLFNSFYTEVLGRALLLSLDCSILPLILTLKCWVLSKVASSTIFWVFGVTRPGIEPHSSRPLVNTLFFFEELERVTVKIFFKAQESVCEGKSWFGLFVWVLCHVNLCRLFNAKSIFIQINSSISNNC